MVDMELCKKTAMFWAREEDKLVYSSKEYTLTPACTVRKSETILTIILKS